MADAPVKRFRIGNLTASVWKNEGQERAFYTVDIQRSYKDGDEWKNTTSLNASDLLNAAFLLQKANNWIMEQ